MTKLLFSTFAVLAMATSANATLLSTFAVQGGGTPNPNVVVTPADLIANPSFVPVALSAGDVVTNGQLINGDPLALENGLSITQSNTGNNQGSFSFSQPATANANPIFQNYLAFNNFFGAPVTPGTLTIDGLDDSLIYNIHLLAIGDTNGQGSVFTLGSETQQTLASDVTIADATLGENLVSFRRVQSTNGSVTFDFAAGAANFAVLSGGQIEVVPEPGSLTLLALLGVAGVVRRR